MVVFVALSLLGCGSNTARKEQNIEQGRYFSNQANKAFHEGNYDLACSSSTKALEYAEKIGFAKLITASAQDKKINCNPELQQTLKEGRDFANLSDKAFNEGNYELACSSAIKATEYAKKLGAELPENVKSRTDKACNLAEQQKAAEQAQKAADADAAQQRANAAAQQKQKKAQQQPKEEMSPQEAMRQAAEMFKLLGDPFGQQPCINYKSAMENCAAAGDIDRCVNIKLQVTKAEIRRLENQCQ